MGVALVTSLKVAPGIMAVGAILTIGLATSAPVHGPVRPECGTTVVPDQLNTNGRLGARPLDGSLSQRAYPSPLPQPVPRPVSDR
jgi:hypothetical protein